MNTQVITKSKTKRDYGILFPVILTLIAALIVFDFPWDKAWVTIFPVGVRVIMHNSEPTELESVAILMERKSFAVGDIASGHSAAILVSPDGDGSLCVAYIDSTGTQKLLAIDCYIQHHDRGAIYASIKNGEFQMLKDEPAFWRDDLVREIP